MKSTVIAHAALLVVAAALAHLAWHKKDEGGDESEVVIAQLEQQDIEELSLTSPESAAKVTPEKRGEEISWSVALDYQEKPQDPPKKKDEKKDDEAKGDAGPAAEDPPPPPPEKKSARFPGGRSVAKSVEALAPLKARRSLGEVDGERLAAMGLEKPERKLVVKAKGQTWTFLIGESTYGDQGRYAMLEGKREVLLLDSAVVRGLEGTPQRLMEASLVDVALDDVTGYAVESAGKKAAFEQREREQPKKRHFVHKGGEERSEEAAGLLSTLRGLRAKEYLDKAALAGATPAARFLVERHEAEPLALTLYERPDGSDYLVEVGGWIASVGSARGKNVVDDVTAVLPAE